MTVTPSFAAATSRPRLRSGRLGAAGFALRAKCRVLVRRLGPGLLKSGEPPLPIAGPARVSSQHDVFAKGKPFPQNPLRTLPGGVLSLNVPQCLLLTDFLV